MSKTIELKSLLKPRRLHREILDVFQKEEIHVYLAGPINFVEDFQEYRTQLTKDLLKISSRFKIHDPWERERMIPELTLEGEEERKDRAETIIVRDLEDITSCDLLLAYVFRTTIIGTAMEIFFASRILKKPVIVIYTPLEEGTAEPPLWLYGHANLIFYSKKSLYKWLRGIFEEVEEFERRRTTPT